MKACFILMLQTPDGTVHYAYPNQTIASNVYKLASPLKAKVLQNRRLTHGDSPNDVHHVVLNVRGSNLTYWDGQSLGVLAPGVDASTGKAHKLRLYSIASPSTGDALFGAETVSLCVKRLLYQTEAGQEGRGVCSNYLCDLSVGDEVVVTGPVGKAFLLPKQPDSSLIMIGTGTGVAPFMGFLATRFGRLAHETGEAHLFFGAQTRLDFLYQSELMALQQAHGNYFKLHTAFSREQQTAIGERLYVQHVLYEQRQHLLRLLQQPSTQLYICGLRGMEMGIIEALKQAAEEEGLAWEAFYQGLLQQGQWHVEVY
jgi:ferredoxin--NADP+ reductase